MDAISDWFKNSKDYNIGVALYATLPIKKTHILKRLNRGKNNHNMATLVAELRKHKNVPQKPVPKKVVVQPHTQASTQEVINIEVQRRQIATDSTKREFGNIKLGDLPPELRPRFLHVQKIFYDMIELKFALNDLTAADEERALKIQLQIEDLDEERDLIWKELHHWQKHKTMLPTKTTDFSDLSELELDRKKRNTNSSISKISKRIDNKYNELDAEKDKIQQRKIENQINRSEKILHQHKINLSKIDKLL